jgi:hypothetical protein
MIELLSKIDGPFLVAIFGVVGCTLIATVIGVAKQWRRVRIAEIDAALKHEMIQRGMSADEMERVLCTSPERRKLQTVES